MLGLEPVSLVIKRGRLWRFRHVECKDDGDWVKRCMSMEIGALGRGDAQERPGGIVSGMIMRSFGLTCEIAQDKVEWKLAIKH